MAYKDKNKQREYLKNWIRERRAQFFVDKSCIKCCSTERLELDHINPETKVAHSIWSWKQEKRDNELARIK